jgi:hypothetical protein
MTFLLVILFLLFMALASIPLGVDTRELRDPDHELHHGIW